MEALRCDVIVVGSGPASHSATIALLHSGLSVVALCREHDGSNQFGEHLAPEAFQAISRLKLSALLNSTDHLESAGILSQWGGPPTKERDYISAPYGSGWNLDRRLFDQALLQAAQTSGAKIVWFHHLRRLERSNERWQVTVTLENSALEVEAPFLVDATGRSASIARKLGHRPVRLDRLVGLYGWRPALNHDNVEPDPRLLIEPMSDGWWYSLLIPFKRLIAVYMTDADLLSGGATAARHLWEERLRASDATKARIAGNSSPYGFRVAHASSQRLSKMSGEGWLSAGDASMALDPLAAAGLTKALNDGLDAAQAIIDSRNGLQSFENYERDRVLAFENYVSERSTYYRQEQRWPQSEFWCRRRVFPQVGAIDFLR